MTGDNANEDFMRKLRGFWCFTWAWPGGCLVTAALEGCILLTGLCKPWRLLTVHLHKGLDLPWLAMAPVRHDVAVGVL